MQDLIITIDRKWKKDKYTVSNFTLTRGGAQLLHCNCIEDTDRHLTQDMALDYIQRKKIYGQTAIPAGEYNVVMSYSNKFGSQKSYAWCKGILPEVQNVPGWSGVRIHAGNTADSSLGCPLVGDNDKPGWVSNSMAWCKKIYPFITETLKAGAHVRLKVLP